MKTYLHLKSGNIYLKIKTIVNCTNEHNGQEMVHYMNLNGKEFVREASEFYNKFKEIEVSKINYIQD